MDIVQLSKLPKELIIDILFKVNEGNFYKVSIRDEYREESLQEFYVKCISEDDIIKMIPQCDEIKRGIIKFWRDYRFDDYSYFQFFTNHNNDELSICNCRYISPNSEEWRPVKIEEFDALVYQLFDQPFKDWLIVFPEDISIKKIDVLEMISK